MQNQEALSLAIQKVGNSHKYQKFVLVFFSIVWFISATILFGPSFLLMNPIFKCVFSDQQVDEIDACPRIKECAIDNDYTIVSYLGLYCDRQFERSLVQSAVPIGSVLGLLILNSVCDIKGRRYSSILCLILGFVGIIISTISAFYDITSLMFISLVLAGFGGYPIMIISYVILFDICEDKVRQSGVLILNMVWSLSELSYFFFNNWFNLWYYYMICVMIIPTGILTVVGYYFLIQSPNFLLDSKKDTESCLESLQKIGRFNGVTDQAIKEAKQIIIESVYRNSLKKKVQIGFKQVLKKVFFNFIYLKPVLILSGVFCAGSIMYYGVSLSLDDIGYGFSINFLIMGFMETLGTATLRFFFITFQKTKRRVGLLIFYIGGGILGIMFAIPSISSSALGSIIIISVIRLVSSLGYSFFTFLQTQSFPSDIQSTGAGLIEALSQIGSFVAPSLVIILINFKIYPVLVFSVIVIIFTSPVYFLKETLGIQHNNDFASQQQSEQASNSIISSQLD